MTNTHPASAMPGPLRRCITGALLVLGITVGSLATTATPAEAAGAVFTCYTAQYLKFQRPRQTRPPSNEALERQRDHP